MTAEQDEMNLSARRPVFVLAPDKFRGSLAASAVCASMARGLRRVWPLAEVRSCPMADRGEGTLDAVLGGVGPRGSRHVHTVSGAGGQPIEVAYGVLDGPDGQTAIIEVARIVGIADPVGMAAPVAARSTKGVGELLRALLDAGLRLFLVDPACLSFPIRVEHREAVARGAVTVAVTQGDEIDFMRESRTEAALSVRVIARRTREPASGRQTALWDGLDWTTQIFLTNDPSIDPAMCPSSTTAAPGSNP